MIFSFFVFLRDTTVQKMSSSTNTQLNYVLVVRRKKFKLF